MKNINFSSSIVSKTKEGDITDKFHRKFLEIGIENLKDFNNRLNVRIQLDYNHEDNSFSVSHVPNNARIQHLSREFLMELNRFVTLVKAQFDQKFIKNEYLQNVESDANSIKQEIRAKVQTQKNGISDREKTEYLRWVDELITLRENSYPLVVLTDRTIIEECKNEVNALCADLSKELTN